MSGTKRIKISIEIEQELWKLTKWVQVEQNTLDMESLKVVWLKRKLKDEDRR